MNNEIPSDYSRGLRIATKLKQRTWEVNNQHRSNLVADIENLGDEFVLWLKFNFYSMMKRKYWAPRYDALMYIGLVADIGAGQLLKNNIIDDELIEDIVRLAEGGANEKEENLEVQAAYALLGIEIARRDGKHLQTILNVLNSSHNKFLINNIAKVPFDERVVDVLISILQDDFLYFRQEGMKTIVEYSTSYWAACALLEIGDERGIDIMVNEILVKFSELMERSFNLSVEVNIDSKYHDFFVEAGKPVVNYLIRGLSSNDRQVCRLAVSSLGGIGDKSAFEAMAAFIKSDITGAIYMTATAFGELGDPKAIPVLLPLLSSNIPGASGAVKKALNKLRSYWHADDFVDVLNDENERVVIYAIDALKDIKDKSAVEPLTALLESDNKKILKSVKKALKKIQ
jgi:hypothetical protein